MNGSANDSAHQAAPESFVAHASALVVAAPELAVVIVVGNDRASWINGLVTCDVAKMRVGDAAYGLATTQKGRILADVIVMLESDRLVLVVPSAVKDELRAAFDHYLIMEDAEMQDDASASSIWFSHGPRSGELLARAVSAGAHGALLDRTDLGGAIVLVPAASRDAIEQAMSTTLAEMHGAIGDAAAWEQLRVERGVPRFGIDFDNVTYPQEASLEKRAVSFSKGCYLGQEVVCMLEMRGHVKRKLMRLAIDASGSRDVPAKGAAVKSVRGEDVGSVTSAVMSDALGGPVAIAMIKYAHAKEGEAVTVGDRKGKIVGSAV